MKRIPFFGNQPDNLHCFQACLRMVLKHFEPDADFPWEQLDEITGMRPGSCTWPTRALLWMKRRGYEIQSIGSTDCRRLVTEGRSYFIELHGEEVAANQFAMCDFDAEMRLLEQYLVEVETPSIREPRVQDNHCFNTS